MKQNIGKRLASLVLALVLAVGMMPMTAVPAHAATESPCSGNHFDWTAISDHIEITQAGNYYLSSDYKETGNRYNIVIECEGEVTLCLNGKALTNINHEKDVIYLKKGSLNLCDCEDTGYIDSGVNGVYALSNTQFNMYGGTIKDCYIWNNYGSAVLLGANATFNMYGGSITGNSAGSSKCGAVGSFSDTNATINIYGGSITGNNIYGVYSEGGSVYISGNAKITGNASGDVYLGSGKTITVGTLTTGADIGVTSASGENDIAITGTNAADYSQYFHADNSDYQILNKDNVIYLHKHSSTYSIGDKPDVLVERCNICSHSAEATLIAENKTYTGSAITDAATVDYSDNWAGSKDTAVIYNPKEGSALTDGKAVNVGKYTASVQVGSATASADFEITQKSLESPDISITFNPESATYPYDGGNPTVIVKDGDRDVVLGTDDYDLIWNEGSQWVTPATNTVTVTGKGNYKDSVDKSFTINPGTLPGTISAENVEKEYDGTGYSITVTGVPDGATVTYSTDGLTYTANNPAIVNVNDSGTVHYKVSKEHYEDFEGSAAVTIKPKAVTVSGITAEDREYDGTANAVLHYDDVTFAGKLDGDALSLTAIGTFDSKDAGENKTVTITGLTLDGASAGNYTPAADGQQTTATATISPKAVTVEVKAENKTYDGNRDAEVSANVVTGIAGETITITGLTGTFDTADADENKTVAVATNDKVVTYGGNAKETNYTLTIPATTTANIGAASMVVTAEDYTGTYDGTSHGIMVNAPEGAKVEYSTDGTVWSETNLQFTNVADSTTVSYRVTKDNYETVTGSKTVTINPIEVTVTVDAIPDQTYTGSAIAPTVTVTPEENKLVEGDTLVKGTDYTVSCSTNTNVGMATVKVEAKGNYSFDTMEKTFLIVPDELLIANLTTENVTSANKANVDKAVQMMNNADLNDAPAEDKADWEALKTLANALQDQLEAADAADETQNIQDVEGINAGNVKLDQKQDLKDALKDLESAKENYYGNYTAEEKAALDADIKRVEDALAAIERVEDFNAAIDDSLLKEDVKTDMDAATEAAIKDAQAAYGELTDYEKTLIDPADKTKLDTLVATITDYKVTKGDGGRYTVGSGKTLSFTANGPVRKFDYVQVNGKTIASSNYTVTEGSTIITLKSSYLDKLGYGKHKIQIFYTDGSTDVANFRIYVSGGNPFTGDNTHMLFFTGIMMTSLLCMVMMVMFVAMKKGKYQR